MRGKRPQFQQHRWFVRLSAFAVVSCSYHSEGPIMGSEGGEGADFIADDNHPTRREMERRHASPFFSKVTVCQPSFWSKKASKQPPFDCMVLVSDTVLCYSSYCCGGEENASFCTSAFRSRRKSAIISHMRTTSKRFHDFSGKLVTCKK